MIAIIRIEAAPFRSLLDIPVGAPPTFERLTEYKGKTRAMQDEQIEFSLQME
jgi:hypothetical protein